MSQLQEKMTQIFQMQNQAEQIVKAYLDGITTLGVDVIIVENMDTLA